MNREQGNPSSQPSLHYTWNGLTLLGWFGFNAGSSLGANEIAVNAFVVTNTAAAAAGLTWAILIDFS